MLEYSFTLHDRMNHDISIKEQITQELIRLLDEKIAFLNQSIEAAKESRNNETKSSVGDKYETGRAMVQMELEKHQAQRTQIQTLKNTLARIDTAKISTTVEFGSLVSTPSGHYFMAIPFGKIEIAGTSVFCLSMASPIGKALAGKSAGTTLSFQGKEFVIQSIL